MIGPYIQAIETRLRWARYANSPEAEYLASSLSLSLWRHFIWPLEHGDTFYMDGHFCRLAKHASETIPSNTEFDASWLQSPAGWLYMEDAFTLPDGAHLRALGWYFDPDADESRVEIVCYRELPDGSFYPLSHHLVPLKGEYLSVIEKAERTQHPDDPGKFVTSVMYWVYAAFHLMAQRMSVTVNQKVDRAVRRRAEKTGETAPEIVKVITLRRMAEARRREAPDDVNWRWQWEVRGHWRNQFYPSENVHKPVFVEAYIKGPTDKPFKSPGLKLFAAVR